MRRIGPFRCPILQGESPELARNGRTDWSPSCPLLGAKLPRLLIVGAAESDPFQTSAAAIERERRHAVPARMLLCAVTMLVLSLGRT
jgi:hypothetical protein